MSARWEPPQWEYAAEGSEDVFGPFSSAEMVAWAEHGYFSEGVSARRLDAAGAEFVDATTVDFRAWLSAPAEQLALLEPAAAALEPALAAVPSADVGELISRVSALWARAADDEGGGAALQARVAQLEAEQRRSADAAAEVEDDGRRQHQEALPAISALQLEQQVLVARASHVGDAALATVEEREEPVSEPDYAVEPAPTPAPEPPTQHRQESADIATLMVQHAARTNEDVSEIAARLGALEVDVDRSESASPSPTELRANVEAVQAGVRKLDSDLAALRAEQTAAAELGEARAGSLAAQTEEISAALSTLASGAAERARQVQETLQQHSQRLAEASAVAEASRAAAAELRNEVDAVDEPLLSWVAKSIESVRASSSQRLEELQAAVDTLAASVEAPPVDEAALQRLQELRDTVDALVEKTQGQHALTERRLDQIAQAAEAAETAKAAEAETRQISAVSPQPEVVDPPPAAPSVPAPDQSAEKVSELGGRLQQLGKAVETDAARTDRDLRCFDKALVVSATITEHIFHKVAGLGSELADAQRLARAPSTAATPAAAPAAVRAAPPVSSVNYPDDRLDAFEAEVRHMMAAVTPESSAAPSADVASLQSSVLQLAATANDDVREIAARLAALEVDVDRSESESPSVDDVNNIASRKSALESAKPEPIATPASLSVEREVNIEARLAALESAKAEAASEPLAGKDDAQPATDIKPIANEEMSDIAGRLALESAKLEAAAELAALEISSVKSSILGLAATTSADISGIAARLIAVEAAATADSAEPQIAAPVASNKGASEIATRLAVLETAKAQTGAEPAAVDVASLQSSILQLAATANDDVSEIAARLSALEVAVDRSASESPSADDASDLATRLSVLESAKLERIEAPVALSIESDEICDIAARLARESANSQASAELAALAISSVKSSILQLAATTSDDISGIAARLIAVESAETADPADTADSTEPQTQSVPPSSDAGNGIVARLAALELATSDSNVSPNDDAIAVRVSALESAKPQPSAEPIGTDEVSAIAARLAALESATPESSAEASHDLSALHVSLVQYINGTNDDVSEIAARLAALESATDTPPPDVSLARMESLEAELQRMVDDVAGAPKADSSAPAAVPASSSVDLERLVELETELKRLAAAEEHRKLEQPDEAKLDIGRVEAIENELQRLVAAEQRSAELNAQPPVVDASPSPPPVEAQRVETLERELRTLMDAEQARASEPQAPVSPTLDLDRLVALEKELLRLANAEEARKTVYTEAPPPPPHLEVARVEALERELQRFVENSGKASKRTPSSVPAPPALDVNLSAIVQLIDGTNNDISDIAERLAVVDSVAFAVMDAQGQHTGELAESKRSFLQASTALQDLQSKVLAIFEEIKEIPVRAEVPALAATTASELDVVARIDACDRRLADLTALSASAVSRLQGLEQQPDIHAQPDVHVASSLPTIADAVSAGLMESAGFVEAKASGPFYSVDELTVAISELPLGVDPRRRERYLTDEVFAAEFGKSKKAFTSMPKWRRTAMKREKGLLDDASAASVALAKKPKRSELPAHAALEEGYSPPPLFLSPKVAPSYSVEELAVALEDLPAGVDARIREQYLSDKEFKQAFSKSKATFAAMAKWRQSSAKKSLGLLA